MSGRRGFFWEEPKYCPNCCTRAGVYGAQAGGRAAGAPCARRTAGAATVGGNRILRWEGGESSVRRLCPRIASWGRGCAAGEPLELPIHLLTPRERLSYRYTLAALKQRADVTFSAGDNFQTAKPFPPAAEPLQIPFSSGSRVPGRSPPLRAVHTQAINTGHTEEVTDCLAVLCHQALLQASPSRCHLSALPGQGLGTARGWGQPRHFCVARAGQDCAGSA